MEVERTFPIRSLSARCQPAEKAERGGALKSMSKVAKVPTEPMAECKDKQERPSMDEAEKKFQEPQQESVDRTVFKILKRQRKRPSKRKKKEEQKVAKVEDQKAPRWRSPKEQPSAIQMKVLNSVQHKSFEDEKGLSKEIIVRPIHSRKTGNIADVLKELQLINF